MRTAAHRAGESPCKDVLLKALTRLNEKSTLRVAAQELAIMIRALDAETCAALVHSICTTTGASEPKPVAKKECIRVLAQLPLASCPVSDLVLHQHTPKILNYLKKNLQDADSQVRDASCDALAAYAQALTEVAGSALPGSMGSPLVRAIFECLTEQKREAQMGASQALLKVSPFIGPLDTDLVKVILAKLKSPSFLGTAQLLAAIASTDAESASASGLLKHGAAAFAPHYVNHLIGQPASSSSNGSAAGSAPSSRGGASSGGGGRAPSSSGILGCMASKDHAVRRAAADAVRAAVVLLGPALEPHGCWGLGDPHSITARCMSGLEECRFDKVKEAREAAREAATLLQQLHRYQAEYGPDTDAWPLWASNNLPYTGLLSPAASPPASPGPTAMRSDSFRQALQHSSPVAERFRQAAMAADTIVDGSGSTRLSLQLLASSPTATAGSDAAAASSPRGSTSDDSSMAQEEQEGSSLVEAHAAEQQQDVEQQPPEEQQQQPELQEQPSKLAAQPSVRRQWSRSTSVRRPGGSANGNGSRPGSANGSSSVSAPSSRRSSTTRMTDAAGAAKPTLPAARVSQGRQPPTLPRSVARASSTSRSAAAAGPAAQTNQGPSEEAHQQMQQQLTACQQLVQQLQQQVADQKVQHLEAVEQLQISHSAAVDTLQARIASLELMVQQQQQPQPRASTVQAHGSRLGPTRCSSSGVATSPVAGLVAEGSGTASPASSSSGGAAAAAAPPSRPEAGERSFRASGSSSCSRLYKSEEFVGSTPPNGMGGRRPSALFTADSVGRSYNGSSTPNSGGSGIIRSYEVATPGDLQQAYADALRGDRGEVHLMRLLAKTGPCWQQLEPHTCQALLAVFIEHVKDGATLLRVTLPWLWRLADEEAERPEVPWRLQQELLEALACCKAPEDVQVQYKVPLLLDTLKTEWRSAA